MKYLNEDEKKFIEQIEKENNKQFHERADEMTIHYIYSVGELTKFFTEIRDKGKLFGTRCVKCGFGFFPPRLNCQTCYEPCEWVELSGKGEITSATMAHFGVSNFGDKTPLAIAFIKMDEMDMAIRHSIVLAPEDKNIDNLKKGTRVKVKFKPKSEREGRITDFYYVRGLLAIYVGRTNHWVYKSNFPDNDLLLPDCSRLTLYELSSPRLFLNLHKWFDFSCIWVRHIKQFWLPS